MGLRWLADECVSASIVQNLRAAGHDVLFIAESHGGMDDQDVLRLAASENRLLLTQDRDHGDLLYRQRELTVPGVVFLRIPSGRRRILLWPRLQQVVEEMGDSLVGQFIVVTESTLRWRSLP